MVDPQAGPGQLESPHLPSLVLGMYFLPTVPTVGTIFKDASLREQCVVEAILPGCMAEPVQTPYVTAQILSRQSSPGYEAPRDQPYM